MRTQRQHPGFTLIEVMVMVAIISIMASVALPNMVSYYDAKRIEASATTFDSLEAGILRFRADISKYPSQFTHLTEEISNADDNSCGVGYKNNEVGSWRNGGPYFIWPVTTDGYVVQIGVADNVLIRTASPVTLQINVPNVRVQDADDLEDLIEPGDNNINNGTIRRTAVSPDGSVTMQYVIEGLSGC